MTVTLGVFIGLFFNNISKSKQNFKPQFIVVNDNDPSYTVPAPVVLVYVHTGRQTDQNYENGGTAWETKFLAQHPFLKRAFSHEDKESEEEGVAVQYVS